VRQNAGWDSRIRPNRDFPVSNSQDLLHIVGDGDDCGDDYGD
jgi:hypothetical protein